MRPVTINPHNTIAALAEIERASHENDLAEIAQNFSIGNAPGAQRTLNGSSVQLSAAGVGNGADTTVDTLFSYTLPAGALSMVGEGLSILAFGRLANNSNSKSVILTFGGVNDGGAVGTTAANSPWVIRSTIFKAGPNSQVLTTDTFIGSTFLGAANSRSITDTAPIVISVTGQSPVAGAANDVTCFGLIVSGYLTDVSDAFATWISDCQKGGMNRTT